MNFWRALILPLLVACYATLGFASPGWEAGAESCPDGSAASALQVTIEDMATEEGDEEPGPDELRKAPGTSEKEFSPRRRSRKCWRPEQQVDLCVLVPVKSPAESSWVAASSFRECAAPVAPSDMMFVVSGYVRLFQKG